MQISKIVMVNMVE